MIRGPYKPRLVPLVRNGRTRVPESLFCRALVLMLEHPVVSTDDFRRVLGQVCESDDQAHNLSNEMKKAGVIERKVCLTPKGMDIGRRMAR